MRFDWYQATVVDDRVGGACQGVLVDELAVVLAATSVDPGPGRWGYGQEDILRDGQGQVVARVLSGGRQPWASVQGSGAMAPAVAEALRGGWRHWVTRMDVADDREAPGAWETLYQPLLGLADQKRLSVSQAGDWHRGEDGRTLYVGSRKSAVFVRLYEKGKQVRSVQPDASVDWVRLELQVRPSKLVRLQAAGWTPEQAWGAAEWTRDVLDQVSGLDVPRVRMSEWQPGDDARALNTLLRQYGSTLMRLYQRLGTEEALGQYLVERIAG